MCVVAKMCLHCNEWIGKFRTRIAAVRVFWFYVTLTAMLMRPLNWIVIVTQCEGLYRHRPNCGSYLFWTSHDRRQCSRITRSARLDGQWIDATRLKISGLKASVEYFLFFFHAMRADVQFVNVIIRKHMLLFWRNGALCLLDIAKDV